MTTSLEQRVATILAMWDPIGVRHFGGDATDEYRSYVPKIAELVARGVNYEGFYQHLWKLEHTSMGLSMPSRRIEDAARELSEFAAEYAK